jgi:hypothetical protein
MIRKKTIRKTTVTRIDNPIIAIVIAVIKRFSSPFPLPLRKKNNNNNKTFNNKKKLHCGALKNNNIKTLRPTSIFLYQPTPAAKELLSLACWYQVFLFF